MAIVGAAYLTSQQTSWHGGDILFWYAVIVTVAIIIALICMTFCNCNSSGDNGSGCNGSNS